MQERDIFEDPEGFREQESDNIISRAGTGDYGLTMSARAVDDESDEQRRLFAIETFINANQSLNLSAPEIVNGARSIEKYLRSGVVPDPDGDIPEDAPEDGQDGA